jgi:hypothetical protein
MEKYTIQLVGNKAVEIEAATALDAVKVAEEQNPEFRADGVGFSDGDYLGVESCGGCGIKMLENEIGGADFDGDSFCKGCYEAMQKEYHTWLHEITTLGYDRGVMITAEIKEEVDHLYSQGTEPKDALECLIADNELPKIN